MIYELRQTLAKQEELQDQFNQLLSENQQLRTVYHEADTAVEKHEVKEEPRQQDSESYKSAMQPQYLVE